MLHYPLGLRPSKSTLCDLAGQLCGRVTLALSNNMTRVFKEIASFYRLLLPPVYEAVLAHHNVPDEFIMRVVVCEQKLAPNGFSKTSIVYILASPITAIINSRPVRESDVPPSWKQTEMLPIPKPHM